MISINFLRIPKKHLKPIASVDKQLQKDGTLLSDISAVDGAVCDYAELDGQQVKGVISYAKRVSGSFKLLRHVEFKNIAIKQNKLYSTFAYNFRPKIELMLDGVEIKYEKLLSASTKDTLTLTSSFMNGATVVRSFYPSDKFAAFIEKIEVTNNTKSKVTFLAVERKNRLTDKSKNIRKASYGLDNKLEVGSRVVDANGDFRSGNTVEAKKLLVSGATAVCYIVYYAVNKGETLNFNAEKEIKDHIKALLGKN